VAGPTWSDEQDAALHRLTEVLPHVVAVMRPDGYVEYLNRRGTDYMGLPPGAAPGWDWAALIHPDDIPRVHAAWERAVIDGVHDFECRLRRADGEYRWMWVQGDAIRDDQGHVARLVSISTDVHARYVADHRNAELAALLETLQASAPVGLSFVDTDLRYARVNPCAAAMMGRSVEDLVGRRAPDVHPPNVWAQLAPAYQRVIEGGESHVSVHASRDPDDLTPGAREWLASYYPVRVDDELVGVGVVAVDLTERQRLEEQLRQVHKMDAIGRLAGGVAHDFNNLLGVVLNYAAFVDEELAAARDEERWEPVRRDLAQIRQAAERGAALTQQLLFFARREVAQPRQLSLNDVVTDVEQLLERSVGEQVRLQLSLAPDLWPVRADPGQLVQVLVNLAVNAGEAMPGGGTVTVDTANVHADPDYTAVRPGLEPGRYVRLRMSDTGTGMSPEVLQQAIEPFFTTKAKGERSGLGLATVYGIVTHSGGRVQLYSEPGHGTTVSILLPAAEDEVAEAAPVQGSPRGGAETVLVVEDEDALREVTARMLVRHGYRVLTAPGAVDALSIVRSGEVTIDLLLTDVVMPGMMGKELADEVRGLHPDTAVLFMSGYARPVLAEQGTLEEGVELVEKPFSEHQLLVKVRQVLDLRP